MQSLYYVKDNRSGELIQEFTNRRKAVAKISRLNKNEPEVPTMYGVSKPYKLVSMPFIYVACEVKDVDYIKEFSHAITDLKKVLAKDYADRDLCIGRLIYMSEAELDRQNIPFHRFQVVDGFSSSFESNFYIEV